LSRVALTSDEKINDDRKPKKPNIIAIQEVVQSQPIIKRMYNQKSQAMHYQHSYVKSLAALILLHVASHAFTPPTPIVNTPHYASRHTSLFPPLHYLSSDEEMSNKVPKKKKPRSLLHRLDRLLTDLQMTQSHLRHHPFLSGNYAPVDKEHCQANVEVVEGSIPMGIWGAFCRNGPNPKRRWMRKRYHWFDGRESSLFDIIAVLTDGLTH
jgi:hypothetical protein